MNTLPDRALTLISQLNLIPHPEGGWYRETYRASVKDDAERAASTMIYFLLVSGVTSQFHRIDADEGWHHYEGDTVRVHTLSEEGYRAYNVGQLNEKVSPQAIVPRGLWFGAELVDEAKHYALVGCTVSPGFEFSHFELADPETLSSEYPQQRELIYRLAGVST